MVDRSQDWYFALLAGFALLRLVELRVSARHQAHLLAVGGKQVREPLYPLMVCVHAGLFIACALEVWMCDRPLIPWLAGCMLTVLGLCVVGRAWIWRSLGEQWNVHIVTSALPVVDNGPYRYVRHPNYTIVIIEIFALPLVHSAYLTALFFSLLNAGVLWQRIHLEEAALWARPEYVAKMGWKPRFLPVLTRGH
jgi:methyltransferase